MKIILGSAARVAALFLILGLGGVTSAVAAILEGIDAASLPGDKVELKLEFDGRPPQIKGYTIEQPARIAIDLIGTLSNVPKYNEIGFANARNVAVLETNERTRLIVSLNNPAGYSTRTEGKNLYIMIGDGREGTAESFPEPESGMEGARGRYGVKEISDIDFHRGEAGEGNIVITLASSDATMDLDETGGRLELSFPGVSLPEGLNNRLDVVDFATPVKFIDARVRDGNALVVIEPEGEYDYLAWQAENKLTVSVKPLTKEESEELKKERFAYDGEKLSLNFQDIEVRSVLQLIADFKDLNLVASDTVGGNVTLRLKNVPWDQALDIVLKSKGLDKRLESNVLTVAPAEELAARERQELESKQQIDELAPLVSQILQINYASADEVASVLLGGEGNRTLSERGSVQVVERTNSLLIQETREKLDAIMDLVEKIDVPVKQVQIEARIVTADTSFEKNIGVKWSGSKGQDGDKSKIDNMFVDLSTAGSSGFTWGFVTDNTTLSLELSALEADGGGEVISQPKIVTSDKQKATIKNGTEIPYQEASSSGATSTSFKEAVLSLEVTPQITPDGRVIMDIKVTNDSVKSTGSSSSSVPSIDKNEVQTKVLVNDGETLVIGGIFNNIQTQGKSKVPLLGDLPGVGSLFSRTTNSNIKKEVLIFITPKIISDTLALR
ncbi:type IV pilus secretin PilQ [Kistimonas asteriae]|uniref:type IV pilus secretin PilQ n=1 Tax=Kistimonas asteriae TaxID=517724 RepID=UPI001BAE2BF1|nr:AMIN domain-containing protein [Kistimonas asteriae]